MKKIIASILFVAAASCNLLFAQPINQVAGCRLQVAGCRKTELSSEDQIEQGVQTTTNYELRTANYNDQGNDLDCYLMMNPSSIEEGTKVVGEALGIFGRGEEAAGVSSTSEGRGDVARISSSSLSNQVLRLRDGGLKSTGNSSDEEESDQEDVELKIAAEDNHPTSNSVNDYLKKEIIKVEKAFSQARKAKSVNGWNEAKAAAITVSNYWNGIIEEIKAGKSTLALSQEEAVFQKEYWIEKAGVAEVKALGAKPCDDNDTDALEQRADEMMAMIRNKVGPTVSKAMKAFIEHPSEATMRDASASASAYAYAYAYASESASASASAYASWSSSVFAFSSASASAFASVAASASVYTSAFSSASASAYMFSSAYASVFAYAYASTALNFFAESSAETTNSAKIFEAVDASNTIVLGLLKDYPTWLSAAAKENIAWSVQFARETATFAYAVVAFKKNQEAASVGARRWKMEDGKGCEEVTREREIEQGKLAEIKAFADSPCENTWSAKRDRANAIMKMTREKFGSPVSPAMKEFSAHPSEAMLRATGKSSIIAMTADEAEEAVETAEIFAKVSADAANFGRARGFDVAHQENFDWSETITREIVGFARAVAAFKRTQETANCCFSKEKETAIPAIPSFSTDAKQENKSAQEKDQSIKKSIKEKSNSLPPLSPFVPKTWYAEQIKIDQKEYDRRAQRVFEAITKIDQERAEKTKSVEQEAAVLEWKWRFKKNQVKS